MENKKVDSKAVQIIKKYLNVQNLKNVIAKSKKVFIVIGVFAVCLSVAYNSYSSYKLSSRELIARNLLDYTAQIDAGEYYGSGVVLESSFNGALILTAQHVCSGAKINTQANYALVYVTLRGKQKTAGHIVRMSETSDLCLVVTFSPSPDLKVVLADRLALPGEEVIHVGYGEGLIGIKKGYAGNYEVAFDTVYQHGNYPSLAGSSGGGVYNLDGELVGVNVLGKLVERSYFIPVQFIKAFLGESII